MIIYEITADQMTADGYGSQYFSTKKEAIWEARLHHKETGEQVEVTRLDVDVRQVNLVRILNQRGWRPDTKPFIVLGANND